MQKIIGNLKPAPSPLASCLIIKKKESSMKNQVKNIENNRIYLSSPHMSDEGYEMEYIKEAFDTNWIAPLGANVDGFEKELASYAGIGHAAALSSGTAAIHMALIAAGVGKGDLVLCQSLTFSATANPIIYQNAIPVFIDSDYKTWNIDPIALEEAFEKYKGKVKAVIIVHLYGLSADMDRIMEICNKYNAVVIEDAAESLGTTYKGKYTGVIGDYGIFSFNGNKIITTSGGGMLVSDNEESISKVRFWATQARDKARHYQHSELGFNYRMSNIVAGIGRGQLKVLDKRIAKKKYIFEYYKKELGDLEGIEFMPINDWNEPNYWLSCIILSDSSNSSRGDLRSPEDTLHSKVTITSHSDRPFTCHSGLPSDCHSEPPFTCHSEPPFTCHSEPPFTCHSERSEESSLRVTYPIGRSEESSLRPIDIMKALEKENIESRPIWKPMHLQPFFREYDYIGGNVSEQLFKNGVCLPSDTKMTDDDLKRVCRIINKLWNK